MLLRATRSGESSVHSRPDRCVQNERAIASLDLDQQITIRVVRQTDHDVIIRIDRIRVNGKIGIAFPVHGHHIRGGRPAVEVGLSQAIKRCAVEGARS